MSQPSLIAWSVLIPVLLMPSAHAQGDRNPSATAGSTQAGRQRETAAGDWTIIEANDLKEWSHPGQWWKVEDGVFVAESSGGRKRPKVHYLVWNGVTGRDFELSLEYRIVSKQPQDAGVNFRVERPYPIGRPNLPGYQAELDTAFLYGKRPGIKQGKLFGNIHDGKRSHMFKRSTQTVINRQGKMTTTPLESEFLPTDVFRRPPEWNECLIRAEQDQIELSLNGVLANRITDQDPQGQSTGQTIALQFRPRFSYRFEVRNLKFRSIPSSDQSGDSPPPASTDPLVLAEQGDWAEAAVAFERLFASEPAAMDTMAGLRLAVLYAQTGQKEEHQEFCRQLFEAFRNWKKPADAERPAKAYLMFPGADDAELLDQAHRGTQQALKSGRGWIRVWFQLSHGMAEYRLGNYTAAVTALNQPRKSKNAWQQIPAQAFTAMARFQQGKTADAKKLLQKAVQDYGRQRDADGDWQNKLAAKLAIDEAQALID